jgi:hypothetical protein
MMLDNSDGEDINEAICGVMRWLYELPLIKALVEVLLVAINRYAPNAVLVVDYATAGMARARLS